MIVSLRGFCAAVAIGIGLLATPRAEAQADDARVTRMLRSCTLCHGEQFQTTATGPHRLLGDEDWQARTGEAVSCANCHGDAAEHIRAGGDRQGVFGFRAESALEQTTRCLGCHRDTHPSFDRSPHAQAGLTCTSCHRQHDPANAAHLLRGNEAPLVLDALSPTTRVCTDCHSTQLTEFAFNERHRLRENILECTSCHDPHAPATRSLLGGFKQEQCVGCHVDKGGPFVFEHPASRVEGCTACHGPHGSPNRHMLANQRVGELCFTCHAAVPQFHVGFSPTAPPRFGLDTQCTNCHSSIHGSNFNPFFLR